MYYSAIRELPLNMGVSWAIEWLTWMMPVLLYINLKGVYS